MAQQAAATTQPRPSSARWGWLVFLALAIAFFFVAFPIYIIRPFRTQHATELAWALRVERFAPWATVILAVLALWSVARLWRAARRKKLAWLRRSGLVLIGCIAIFFAAAARLDVYEFMFHPISAVRFVPEASAGLAADDMVMTANFGGEAHAYPIREMAYHHVVNDVVGGVPVAATY